MLYRQHVIAALDQQREEFVSFEREWQADVALGARLLRELGGRRCAEIQHELGDVSAPGALPCEELERAGGVALGFASAWGSHEDARRWALDILAGRVTFAADGSQILPGREVSLPVAGVQVAWFENPHTHDGQSYTKDARFRVVTPRELLEAEGGAANAGAIVNARRFKEEVRAASEFLERKRGWQERGERLPVAFFDGMLLFIAAGKKRNETSPSGAPTEDSTEPRFPVEYARAASELVRLSRDCQVPVVGFIDQSYARDLVNLVGALDERLRHAKGIYDAQLLRAKVAGEELPLLSGWGDRTIFFRCLREGLTNDFRDEQGQPLVGFVYLQTTGDGSAPARLDLPAWIYEAGWLDEVLDTVRAECVVGNGYPYPLEAADQTAVMTARDREHFLRVMQEFAERESFGFSISRKATSKARRR